MISARIESISPARAQLLLDTANIGNRRLRRWWVAALAAATKRGEWITTHQGIAFTQSGRLLDGQHRLESIVLSGCTVEMFVFTGIPDEAFKVIDVGVKRTVSDVTGLEKRTAEVARYISKTLSSHGVTAQTVLDVADMGVEELHARLMTHCGKNKAHYSAAPVRTAAITLVMDGHSEQEVFSTYANLVNQQFDQLPPVAHSFIRQVTDKKVNSVNGSDILARALKALNPQNKMITKIQVSDAECGAATEYIRKVFSRIASVGTPTPARQSTNFFNDFSNQRIAA